MSRMTLSEVIDAFWLASSADRDRFAKAVAAHLPAAHCPDVAEPAKPTRGEIVAAQLINSDSDGDMEIGGEWALTLSVEDARKIVAGRFDAERRRQRRDAMESAREQIERALAGRLPLRHVPMPARVARETTLDYDRESGAA